jgi:glycosyltransferase involved in cell wall biosynthesis
VPREFQDETRIDSRDRTIEDFSRVSIVIPVYNEEDNVALLHDRLISSLEGSGYRYEVVYVDDGSTDSSFARLCEIADSHEEVTVVRFRRNFGQTAAISAGMDYSTGEIVVLLDADLQNDPADVPALLCKIEEGYDLVSGWRKYREDNWLLRTLPSLIANRLIGWATGIHLHDYGCTLKAYRRDLVDHLRLYGEMHRFIPALSSAVGASMAEIEVTHHPRVHGVSKYGLARTIRVMLDLATVKFLTSFGSSPIYLFGTFGLAMILGSFVSGTAMALQKFLIGVSFIQTPLLLLSALLFILGTHAILLGFTTELLVRTYHESQKKPTYIVRQIVAKGRRA